MISRNHSLYHRSALRNQPANLSYVKALGLLSCPDQQWNLISEIKFLF